jgi:hypothetical protein
MPHTMGGNISAGIIPGKADQSVDLNSRGGKIALILPSAFPGEFDRSSWTFRFGSRRRPNGTPVAAMLASTSAGAGPLAEAPIK